MENENNILKWLNGEMSAEELKDFKQTDDYAMYAKIAETAQQIHLPELNPELALQDFKKRVSAKKKTKVIPLYQRALFKVAAAVIISLGLVLFFLRSSDTVVSTQIAENKILTLQDSSIVRLNAGTILTYDEDHFQENRELTLEGEAFFDVTKKGTFTVETSYGNISVLGTSFNIKSRKGAFDVFCFSGKVAVNVKDQRFVLTKGEGVRLDSSGKATSYFDQTLTAPNWMNNESTFYEVPYQEVIEEFQRQFDVTIEVKGIDENRIFTGAFDNTSMDSAIKSITLPLNLQYRINNDTIEIFK
jgi:ferric-dicitrate binding protein FerR (iron transport regulator)